MNVPFTWIRGFLYFGHPQHRGSKSEKAQHEVTQTWNPPEESWDLNSLASFKRPKTTPASHTGSNSPLHWKVQWFLGRSQKRYHRIELTNARWAPSWLLWQKWCEISAPLSMAWKKRLPLVYFQPYKWSYGSLLKNGFWAHEVANQWSYGVFDPL